MWVSPTDEELFKKYNPELQKKSLERRYEKQKDFDDFVVRLKEYSKSDKPSTCEILPSDRRSRRSGPSKVAEKARDIYDRAPVLTKR